MLCSILNLVSSTIYKVEQNKWGVLENKNTHKKDPVNVKGPGTYDIDSQWYLSKWPSDEQVI